MFFSNRVSFFKGKIDGTFGRRFVRIFGRRISGSFRIYIGGVERNRKRHRYDENDATHQGSFAPFDSDFEKQVGFLNTFL